MRISTEKLGTDDLLAFGEQWGDMLGGVTLSSFLKDKGGAD